MDDFEKAGRRPLIIFDCDGVLIDSERLYFKHMAQWLRGEGISLPEARYLEEFNGKSLADRISPLQKLFADNGAPVDENTPRKIQEELEKFYSDIGTDSLPVMPGIGALLAVLHESNVPYCTVSNSRAEKLDDKLRAAGLYPFFATHIYSKDLVKNPKPSPDLFIHAARKEYVSFSDCLVIEDSLPGIKAAASAGMTVIGFCPQENANADELKIREDRMEKAGADFIASNMQEVGLLIRAFLEEYDVQLIEPGRQHEVGPSTLTNE